MIPALISPAHAAADNGMMLRILVDGRPFHTAPFFPEDVKKLADALKKNLPAMRRAGRVVVFVTEGNVAHFIAR
jgi:hypothetical protein